MPRITHREPIRTAATLTVDGASTLTGAASLGSTLAVDGALTLQSRALLGTPVVAMRRTMNVSTSGVAGTHTATFSLPAGAIISNIIVHAVAVWNAGTSATLIVGDTDDDGFFVGVNMKATDLAAGESISFFREGGKGGAYYAGTGTHWTNTYAAAARDIVAKLTLVGTTATTGETVIEVHYSLPSATYTSAAVYAAT